MKVKRLSKEQIQELCSLYETEKYNFKDLDNRFGLGLGSVRGLLIRRGYKAKSHSEMNRKYTLKEDYFDNIDSEDKAYFLGFLYADGCNFPEGTRVIIGLHEKDKHILEEFKNLLDYQRPLQYREFEDSGNQYCLNISSKKISEQLEKLGVVKAKSLILKFPAEEQVPKELQSHFIRGYFDGDGCITSSVSPKGIRHERSSTFKWSIVGTESFVKSVQDIMIDKLGLNITKLRKHRNVNYLEYKGNKQVKNIMNWLYNDSNIYLQRKYEKYKNIK